MIVPVKKMLALKQNYVTPGVQNGFFTPSGEYTGSLCSLVYLALASFSVNQF
jgi:hypothetical protein